MVTATHRSDTHRRPQTRHKRQGTPPADTVDTAPSGAAARRAAAAAAASAVPRPTSAARGRLVASLPLSSTPPVLVHPTPPPSLPQDTLASLPPDCSPLLARDCPRLPEIYRDYPRFSEIFRDYPDCSSLLARLDHPGSSRTLPGPFPDPSRTLLGPFSAPFPAPFSDPSRTLLPPRSGPPRARAIRGSLLLGAAPRDGPPSRHSLPPRRPPSPQGRRGGGTQRPRTPSRTRPVHVPPAGPLAERGYSRQISGDLGSSRVISRRPPRRVGPRARRSPADGGVALRSAARR